MTIHQSAINFEINHLTSQDKNSTRWNIYFSIGDVCLIVHIEIIRIKFAINYINVVILSDLKLVPYSGENVGTNQKQLRKYRQNTTLKRKCSRFRKYSVKNVIKTINMNIGIFRKHVNDNKNVDTTWRYYSNEHIW